jgi:galactonate dehydratase
VVTGAAIRRVDVRLLKVSSRSHWIMVELETADGRTGAGEASLHFSHAEVRDAVLALGQPLAGKTPQAALRTLAGALSGDLVNSSAVCALDQALHDLEAQARGLPICRLLAREPAGRLEVYANINRRTHDRSAEGFAASARDAVAAGFSAVKIAPFDDLTPQTQASDAQRLLDAGFGRIAAVRVALGPDRRLLVDCHWRLAPWMLPIVIEACVAGGVSWLETPYPEDDARLADIRAARAACNARGVRLAGAELKIGRAAFARLLAAGCYDVLMPDMKYVGGYGEFVAVAEAAGKAGAMISPHNPTGPVCHAHSVQAAAAIAPFMILEMQFDETDAFGAIVDGELPMPSDGWVSVPQAPGLGVSLRGDRMAPLEAA